MIKRVAMTYNGTGAAVYLCLGFVPDWVKLTNNNATYQAVAYWNKEMMLLQYEGILEYTGTTYIARTPIVIGAGITPYLGGDALTSANQTSVAYGSGVYLVDDSHYHYEVDLTNGVQGGITKWTLDTLANRTGHFDNLILASGGRIGVGSKIGVRASAGGSAINPIQEAVITALDSIGVNDTTADKVTLSAALPTGSIAYIRGKYGMRPLELGKITPAGIKIAIDTTHMQPSNALVLVEAGLNDA